MPTIAIAPCGKLPDYVEAVRRAGGEPRVIDRATDTVAAVLDTVDGVLLAGGGDVEPSLYDAAAHPTFDAAEPGRDAFELHLTREALARDVPLLAICRGLQVLNVALGGSLVQDIPDEVGTMVLHDVRTPVAHEVRIEPGTLLERLLRGRVTPNATCSVNSRHHQAPKAIGAGLVVSATAPDGIVEALESPRHRFCLGVQWHPENFWPTGEFKELFEGFVGVCRK